MKDDREVKYILLERHRLHIIQIIINRYDQPRSHTRTAVVIYPENIELKQKNGN